MIIAVSRICHLQRQDVDSGISDKFTWMSPLSMFTMTTAHPPQYELKSHPVLPEAALGMLQTYLAATRHAPHLHPDALLTERGPQLAASEEGGLALHHLRRVEAGLRGERLGNLDLKDGGGDETAKGGSAMEVVAESEWQDMDSYARAQEVEEGDIGPGSNGVVADATHAPEVRPTGVDKEARKRAKKERAKDEKRHKAAKERRQAKMDD